MFGRTELLAQFCVCGHGLDQPVMLTTLSEIGRRLDRPTAMARLEELLAEINAELPAYERIKQMFVVAEEWSMDNGMLTPTMKLKRKSIEGRFRAWIEKSPTDAPVVFEQAAVS